MRSGDGGARTSDSVSGQLLAVSPSLAAEERTAADQVARDIGVDLFDVTQEGSRARLHANGPDRCFHLKDGVFSRISDGWR
jgi:pyridinium-3,5-biscarboxylic acid mononucleotide sulfurtransferase